MNNNIPLVTIIALCYNHSKYVLETLESIKNQTYTNIQLIVIDNASNDDSSEKISNWIKNSEFQDVLFFPEKANLGVCPALNKALKLTKGKYYQFISCDDILLCDKILKQVQIFETLPVSVAFIYGNFQYIDEKSEVLDQMNQFSHNGWIYQSDLPSGRIQSIIANNYFISAPTLLYRTNCVKEIGGYDETISFEDFQLNLRLLGKFSCYGLIDVLCLYRVLTNSFYHSSSEIKIEKNYLHALKYIYGNFFYENWMILLRYTLFKNSNSIKFKIIKKIIFYLLNIAEVSYKKEYGIKS